MATRRILYFRVRAFLCVALILQIHLPGCSVPLTTGLGDWISIPLSAEHPLSIALEKSIFAGVSAIEISPVLMAFRLRSPDGSRSMTGSMGARGAAAAVRTMRISSASASIDFEVDASDHITRISSGEGRVWTRPADNLPPDPELSLLDSYLASNPEIVQTAAAMDGTASAGALPGPSQSPPGSNGKAMATDQSSGSLTNLLGVLAALVGLQFVVANFPAVYFAFQVFVAMEVTFGLLGIAAPSTPQTPNGGEETPSGNPIPGTTGGNTASGNGSGGSATMRVSNVLTSGVPIWYVVPVPNVGEQSFGNLLGNGAIPAGDSRDFTLPHGVRTINLICPDHDDCLRVYGKSGVELQDGEITDVVLSNDDLGNLYPLDCGG